MRKPKPVNKVVTKYRFSRKVLDDRGADILNALENLHGDLDFTTPNDLYSRLETISDDLGALLSDLSSEK